MFTHTVSQACNNHVYREGETKENYFCGVVWETLTWEGQSSYQNLFLHFTLKKSLNKHSNCQGSKTPALPPATWFLIKPSWSSTFSVITDWSRELQGDRILGCFFEQGHLKRKTFFCTIAVSQICSSSDIRKLCWCKNEWSFILKNWSTPFSVQWNKNDVSVE